MSATNSQTVQHKFNSLQPSNCCYGNAQAAGCLLMEHTVGLFKNITRRTG